MRFPLVESVHKPRAIEKAADTLEKGGTVLVPALVLGWIARADSPEAIKQIVSYKGEVRNRKPFAVFTTAREAVRLIDYDQIAPDLREILSTPELLASLVGGVSFLRVPLSPRVELQEIIKHRDESDGITRVQVFCTDGNPWLENLAIKTQERKMITAITSFNRSGEPERVWHWQGLVHGAVARVPFILRNSEVLRPSNRYFGSYAIVEADTNGLKLSRHGNISLSLLEAIWKRTINASAAKERRYRDGQLQRTGLLADLSGPELREKILDIIIRRKRQEI